jgi:uncharacterized membrane protein
MTNPAITTHQRLANFICCGFFSLWAVLLWLRFQNFGYYDWDLAFFAQAQWQLAHGSQWVSLFGTNFFANHANLIAIPITPLYWLFPHAFLLVLLKIASVTIAGWVIFQIAKEKIGGEFALWLMILFFIYPANIFAVLYEFDMESLAPGFLALAYYFYTKDQWKPFLLMLAGAVLIKENIPLVVAMFGLFGLFSKQDKWKWGGVPLILGVLSFLAIIKIIIPACNGKPIGSEHTYINHYAHLGDSLSSVLQNALFHPVLTLKKVLTVNDINWGIDLFGSLLFLPLLAPAALLITAPLWAQHLLSASWQEHSIFFNYSLTLAPFIFFSLIAALAWLQKKIPARMFFIMSCLFMTCLVSLTFHWQGIRTRYAPEYTNKWNTVRQAFLKQIPAKEPVLASFCFLPSLVNRSGLYAFHRIYSKEHNLSGKAFPIPEQVHYALIDLSDPFYTYAVQEDPLFVHERLKRFYQEGQWHIKAKQGPVYLLQRN